MTIVLINPNSTVAMTEGALEASRDAAPGLAFEGWTSLEGPPAIQGEADGQAATGPLLELVRRADADGAEGIVIACFDDTGLAEARALARCPVIGLGQAAFTLATLIGDRFAVVTTTEASLPVIEGNIHAGGFAGALVHLGAAGVPVLDLETAPERSAERILAASRTALADRPGSIVLGCAGMVRIIAKVRAALSVPVIDGVTAAACLMQATIRATR